MKKSEEDSFSSSIKSEESNRPQERKRRIKTSFRSHDILLDTTQRNDVVLKTILRLMKRFFLLQFNTVTSYSKLRREKEPSFYYEKIQEYVAFLSKHKNAACKNL